MRKDFIGREPITAMAELPVRDSSSSCSNRAWAVLFGHAGSFKELSKGHSQNSGILPNTSEDDLIFKRWVR
jgi:hypothetical protein